jgi:hypothetical protein
VRANLKEDFSERPKTDRRKRTTAGSTTTRPRTKSAAKRTRTRPITTNCPIESERFANCELELELEIRNESITWLAIKLS